MITNAEGRVVLPARSGGIGFGIDIGGTGMKAAPVDLATGELIGPRVRFDTPQPATPDAMAPVVAQLVSTFEYDGPIGIALPSVVRSGVVYSAANIDPSWIGVDAVTLFGGLAPMTGRRIVVVNDADAAGVAEVRLGAGRDRSGVVLMLTFGTGIGSGLFVDGHLVPNTELGHIEIDGADGELHAAASARRREGLTWEQWAARVGRYLDVVIGLFSPDLIIIGGGAAKKSTKWFPHLRVDTSRGTEIVVAALTNNAGIVGAALLAHRVATRE